MLKIKPQLHISLLNVEHPQYIKNAPTWRTVAALIEGYTAVRKNVERFLPLRPGEDNQLYQMRVAKLSYTPLLSAIVNRYVGKMAGSEIVCDDNIDYRLQAFRENNSAPNQPKRNEKNTISAIFKYLLQYATVWVTVDTNTLENPPQTMYEEKNTAPIRPFCYFTDPLLVTQWGDGWHVTREIVQTAKPFEPTSQELVYTYYSAEIIAEYKGSAQMAAVADVEGNSYLVPVRLKIGEDWVSVSDPKAVLPLTRVVQKTTPKYNTVHVELEDERWLCKQLYSKQIQHLQLETSWTDAGYIAGTIQRVFTPMDSPPIDDARTPYEAPDYAQELAKAGNAHILVAKSYQFVESTGGAIANQQGMLDKIESQMYSLAALHFASVGHRSALQQSGASKAIDMALLDDTLRSYGDLVLSVYNAVFAHSCAYLGIESVAAKGLSEFDAMDLDTAINLVATVGTLADYPAEMRLALYNKMMALAKIDVQVMDLPKETSKQPQ